MEAMEQSSIQTSDSFSSAHTTTPKLAPFKKPEPLFLASDSFSSKALSVTNTNRQGLMPREVGARSAASFNSSIVSRSISNSLYFRILRLFLNMSSMIFAS
jgi:hypothetical protein